METEPKLAGQKAIGLKWEMNQTLLHAISAIADREVQILNVGSTIRVAFHIRTYFFDRNPSGQYVHALHRSGTYSTGNTRQNKLTHNYEDNRSF